MRCLSSCLSMRFTGLLRCYSCKCLLPMDVISKGLCGSCGSKLCSRCGSVNAKRVKTKQGWVSLCYGCARVNEKVKPCTEETIH